jgi:clan AA aspartic protease
MKGYIDTTLQPKCSIIVKGLRKAIKFDVIIDTDFNGYRCLPISIAIQLGLELRGHEYIELADGSIKHELTYLGEAIWENSNIPVEISLTESNDALLGTRLLEDKKLTIDYPEKSVFIEDI